MCSVDAFSWSWLFDSVRAATHSFLAKPKLVQDSENCEKKVVRNGKKKGKQSADLPNKRGTVHCIIQMHCSLLFRHKLYK